MDLRQKRWPIILTWVIALCLNLSFFHTHQIDELLCDSDAKVHQHITENTVNCPISQGVSYSTPADTGAFTTYLSPVELIGIYHEHTPLSPATGPARNKSPPLLS